MLLDMVPQLRASEESALRRDHRDSITPLSNTAVHRKNVDDDMLAESWYIYMRGWEIGEEVTTLRCECPSWAHEACLAKSVFETGGCPTCRKSILLIDDEIVLGQAAQMEMQRSSDGYWRTGSSILHEAFSIRRPYYKLCRMASGRPYVCNWNMVPLYRNRMG